MKHKIRERKMAASMAALLVFALLVITRALAAEPQTGGILLLADPLTKYVELVQFTVIREEPLFATVTLRTGGTRQFRKNTVIARIPYPPGNPVGIAPETAQGHIAAAQKAASDYPTYKAQLLDIQNRWQNVLNVVRAAGAQRSAIPVAGSSAGSPRTTTLTVSDTNLLEARLAGFNDGVARIVHADGVTSLPVAALTKEQIAALNGTSDTAQIDPDWKPPVAAAGDAKSSAPALARSNPQNPIEKAEKEATIEDANLPEEIARIGSPVSEFVTRYGKPIATLPGLAPYETGYDFRAKGIRVGIEVIGGRAASIVYEGNGFSEDEAVALLRKNSNNRGWSENDADLLGAKYPFARKDQQAFARFIAETRSGYMSGIRAVMILNRQALALELEKARSSDKTRMKKAEDFLKGF